MDEAAEQIPAADCKGDGRRFRERHGLADDDLLITVLPGSRAGDCSDDTTYSARPGRSHTLSFPVLLLPLHVYFL